MVSAIGVDARRWRLAAHREECPIGRLLALFESRLSQQSCERCTNALHKRSVACLTALHAQKHGAVRINLARFETAIRRPKRLVRTVPAPRRPLRILKAAKECTLASPLAQAHQLDGQGRRA